MSTEPQFIIGVHLDGDDYTVTATAYVRAVLDKALAELEADKVIRAYDLVEAA